MRVIWVAFGLAACGSSADCEPSSEVVAESIWVSPAEIEAMLTDDGEVTQAECDALCAAGLGASADDVVRCDATVPDTGADEAVICFVKRRLLCG